VETPRGVPLFGGFPPLIRIFKADSGGFLLFRGGTPGGFPLFRWKPPGGFLFLGETPPGVSPFSVTQWSIWYLCIK